MRKIIVVVAIGLSLAVGWKPGSAAAAGFSGISVSAFAEYSFSDVDFAQSPVFNGNKERVSAVAINPNVSGSSNLNGLGAGILLGYDVMIGPNVLVGAVADVSVGDWKSSYDFGPALAGFYDMNFAGSIRGRLGYLVTPQALAYVTGGYAIASVRHGGVAVVPTTTTFHADGWTLGGGGELLVGGQMALFLEYLHTEYGTSNFVLHNANHPASAIR